MCGTDPFFDPFFSRLKPIQRKPRLHSKLPYNFDWYGHHIFRGNGCHHGIKIQVGKKFQPGILCFAALKRSRSIRAFLEKNW